MFDSLDTPGGHLVLGLVVFVLGLVAYKFLNPALGSTIMAGAATFATKARASGSTDGK